MTDTDTTEYRKLELDSSNDIIRHDARRSDRKYAEAAWHALQAGISRQRMGQMMFDAGDFTRAAEDWLSAAACFNLATDSKRMQETLARVQKLDQEGKIPPERRDIHEAMNERVSQLLELTEKLCQFDQEYSYVLQQMRAGNTPRDFLRARVRELPGLAKLHALLTTQANKPEELPLAFSHLEWADKFDPGNPNLGALRTRLLLTTGKFQEAIQVGRATLTRHPEMAHLRVLLAQAIAAQPSAQREDWEQAIEVLRPLTETDQVDREGQLLALSLSTILQHGLGHETEYHRLLRSFDQLAELLSSPQEQRVVNEVRRILPHVFSQTGTNGTTTGGNGDQLHAAVRHFGELFNLSAA